MTSRQYRDAAGRVRTRTRPTQREAVQSLVTGWRAPDFGRLSFDAPLGPWLLVVGLALLIGGALAAASLAARGTERRVPTLVAYEVQSSLIYAAPTSASGFEVFDPASGVAPPVNLDVGAVLPLAHFVSVFAGGELRSDVRLSGEQLIQVEVRGSGPAQPLASATGRLEDPDGGAALELELPLLSTVLAGIAASRGDAAAAQVVVTASGSASGELAGAPFSTPVLQQLTFGLDGRELRLLSGSEPLTTIPGEVSGTVTEPRFGSVPLLGDVRLSSLLVAAIVVAVIGLVLSEVVVFATLRERGASELRRARRRYGHLMVAVATVELPEQVLRVSSMPQLARVAQRMRRPILEVRGERTVEFVVLEPGLAYCHSVRRT